jgi:signal transduction histidine kinase
MRLKPGRGLSFRLLWLTVALVLAAGLLVLMRVRLDWLERHVRDGETAALAVAAAPDRAVDAATGDALLRLSGAASVRLDEPGQPPLLLAGTAIPAGTELIDLRDESRLQGLRRALTALATDGDALLRVQTRSDSRPAATIEVLLPQNALGRDLRRRAGDIALIAVLGALAAGTLGALLRRARRPAGPLPTGVPGGDLEAVHRDLRTAQWRNARLAALVATIGRAGHDLRGILSPTLLMAERLQMNADPKIVRAGDVVVRDVDRATELLRCIVEYAREAPTGLSAAPLDLRETVAEAAAKVAAANPSLEVENAVPEATAIHADAGAVTRVFTHLLRNAAEAGAHRVQVGAVFSRSEVTVTVEDDGPGLPEPVQHAIFRPYPAGTSADGGGLGLATAYDLVRAHGGELVLLHTGATGTAFRLTLPTPQGRIPLSAEAPAVARPAA